jgi:hypothetical protein
MELNNQTSKGDRPLLEVCSSCAVSYFSFLFPLSVANLTLVAFDRLSIFFRKLEGGNNQKISTSAFKL